MSNSKPIALRGYHWTQKELRSSLPGIFYLALNMSSACNYACPYCFVGLENLKPSPEEMDFDEKARVIREAADCGARVLSMPGRGEPLIDPDFYDIVDVANELGMHVVVYTNGYSLNEDRIRRLKKANISLYLKVDSFEKKAYEKMVDREGVFDKVMRNLNMLCDIFHEPVETDDDIISRLGINSVVTVDTVDSIQEIKEWCDERDIFFTCRSPVKVGEAEENWKMLVEDRVRELRHVGNKHASRNFTSATPEGQCGIYRFGITVENTGEIYVCPDAREGFGEIGSVLDKSLSELIEIRNEMYPINDESGYCFVKAHRNPEEQEESTPDNFVSSSSVGVLTD